jgi:hypothetical protein
LHNPHVTFYVNNNNFEGYARMVDDKESGLILSVSSLMNKKYGWSDGLIVELYHFNREQTRMLTQLSFKDR